MPEHSASTAETDRDRIFTLSTDLICVAGFDGYFKRVNPAFVRVLGYSEAELLSRSFLSLIHPDDLPATREELDLLASGRHDDTRSFRNRYCCADGSHRWLEWNSTPSLADRLVYCIARDVTGQKAVERKLEEYAREMERSNSELQTFAYVASHDLQEPLRAVAGCMQMLAERNPAGLDDVSRELMGHAVDGAKRMQALINDLLSYSRIGSKGIQKVLVEPRELVHKALRQLFTAVNESGATVDIGPLPQVWADPLQLTQLFQNLIGNGIKFRGGNTPLVTVRADAGASETLFSVSDNGIGIDPQYKDRLFTVFQRLNPRAEYPGNGIGLAICKKVVDRHGGRIWVESQPGAGATFKFTIPERTSE